MSGEKSTVKASEGDGLSENSRESKDDDKRVIESESSTHSRSSKSVEAAAKPTEPSPSILPKSKPTSNVLDEIEKINLVCASDDAPTPKANSSMQPQQSRATGEFALSPGDVVLPAAMSGNGSEVKRGITETEKSLNSRPEHNGIASTKDEQPERPIIDARRVTQLKRIKLIRNKPCPKAEDHITPQLPPEKAHDPQQVHSSLRNQSTQTVKKDLGTKEKEKSYSPTKFLGHCQPIPTVSETLCEGDIFAEDSHRAPFDSKDLCTPEADIGQGRSERTPCPKEMLGFGFKPTNRLVTQVEPALHIQANSGKNVRRSPSASNQKAFDFARPAKKQRTESYTGSSATSPVPIIDDSEDHSNTAGSECPSTSVRKLANKGPQNSHQSSLVSDTSEFRSVESTVTGTGTGKRNNKRSSADPSHTAKRQRLDKEAVSLKPKLSSRLKTQQESSMGNSNSLEITDDPIVTSPPGRWAGTARPTIRNGTNGSRRNSTSSPYFGQHQPGQSSIGHSPNSSSRLSSNKNKRVQPPDDSPDELALDNPKVPSKQEGARKIGASLLSRFALKKNSPDRGDIPKTNFVTSNSSNPRTRNISFGLSSFVAGTSMMKHEENSGAWRITYDTNDTDNKIFEPFKNGIPVAKENRELRLKIITLLKIFFAEDSQKLIIERKQLAQKSATIGIELESSNPGVFIQCLHELDPNANFETFLRSSENIEKQFKALCERAELRIKTMPKQVEEADDVKRIETRHQQRQMQSQQNGNNMSLAASSSKMTRNTGMFNGVNHTRPIDVDINDRGDLGASMNRSARPRRSTRAATQDQKILIGFDDDEPEILPPRPPVWTVSHPDWRKKWGTQKSQLSYPAIGKDKALVDLQDIERLDEGEFLNDNLISFYLRYIQENLQQGHPDVAKSIHFHNTFFYNNLTKGGSGKLGINYDAVKRWTSKVDLFSKEFIVVPINEDTHWYLAIVYNAPALKPAEPEPSFETGQASTLVKEQEAKDVQSEKAKTLSNGQATEEHRDGILDQSEHDLLSFDKMRIADEPDLPGNRIRESSHEMIKNQAGSGDLVVSETVERDTRSPIAIIDSPPNSPQKASQRATSPIVHHSSPLAAPQEQVNGSSTSKHQTSGSKKNKRNSRPSLTRKCDPYKTYIIILDSLSIGHKATSANLKSYLIAEADAKLGKSVDGSLISGVNGLKDCIPQQDNYCDCGVFLLGYAEKFLEDPASFVHDIITKEMHVQTHWKHMDASAMRNSIRELIFTCKRAQDDIKKVSPKKTSKAITDRKNQGPGNSSRESSEQSNRPRPSSDSPSRQLYDSHSRPTSANSQQPKNQKPQKLPQFDGSGQDLTVVGRASVLGDDPECTPAKKGLTTNDLSRAVEYSKEVSPEKTLSSPSKKRLRSPSDAQDSSSRRSTPSSVVLEDARLASRYGQRFDSTPVSSRRGSLHNLVQVIDDEASPSSPGTLANLRSTDVDRMQVRDKQPPQRIQVTVPGIPHEISDGEEDLREVSDPQERSALQEIPDSQEVMLLDTQLLNTEDQDDFLDHPQTPTALLDDRPASNEFLIDQKYNSSSTAAPSSSRASGRHTYEVSPNSRGASQGQRTYSHKGRNGHREKQPKPNVVDLSND